MFSVDSHNVITITRGDSAFTVIFINQGTLLEPERYELQGEDTLYIGVMEPGQRFEDAVIKYRLTTEDLNQDGDALWVFKPTDTEYLEPGKYFYEIKLVRGGEETATVEPESPSQPPVMRGSIIDYVEPTDPEFVDTVVSKTLFFIQD